MEKWLLTDLHIHSTFSGGKPSPQSVIPVKTGIQSLRIDALDSCFRRNDNLKELDEFWV